MKVFKNLFDRFGNMPIFKKIAFTYGGIFSISLILISLFVSGSASFFFDSMNNRELKNVSKSVENYILNGNIVTSDILGNMDTNHIIEINVIEYTLGNPNISIISSTPNNPFFREFISSESSLNTGFNTLTIDNKKIRSYQKRIVHGDSSYMIQTFRLVHKEESLLKFLYTIFIIANLIGIISSFLIGAYVSKRMLKPIKDITHTAERISIEDLNQRIEISGPNDDLKDLANTFNAMIERLDISFKKQNQFVSDASHELRTPIAIIQGYINLMDRWGKANPSVLQESIDSIKSETEHMSKLVKKLLFLAKSDQNKTQIQKEIINLVDIGNEIQKEIEIMKIEQDFIFVKNQPQINVIGDYNLIKQMVWILIENSIKYTQPHKSIVLNIYSENKFVYISVKDEGDGIPQKDIPYIFNRFYRADKSRNKDIPGTGLGLSIAQWIAQQHEAKIRVSSEMGKGSDIVIVFAAKDDIA